MVTSVTDAFKHKMTDEDFGRLSSFVYEELGIKMPYPKKIMLQGRLQKRISTLNLSSFKEYIDYSFSDDSKDSELIIMIDLITTNKTDFYRESAHFDFLTSIALPEICSEKSVNKTIRIWSAGCSSGEEPYTIAIVMKEFLQHRPDVNFEILGTDISMRILEKAAQAVYSADRIVGIPLALKHKYFLKSKDPSVKLVKVVPEIRSKVKFERLNFMDSYYNTDRDFDIIFCRNVLIYFDREIQQNVINKLAARLRHNGIFFLGHSESITNMNVPLKQIKPTIFRKV
jgi:chemotaxis protein methyltransferase CheR